MAIGLVPYQQSAVGGMTGWTLPDGATSSIDLRRLSQITDPAATGYAIAIYAGVLPDGAVELDTGNTTRDRDAWFSTLGFRPEGDTAVDQAWSMLLDGADDAHADAVRPLRCGRPDRFEMWLGGRQERATTHIERLKQAVYTRRDLDAIFDDVQAGKLPDGIHRKALKAEADRLGLDWQTLRSKATRWKNETALEPTTEINDPFKTGSFVFLNTYNGWTTPQESTDFQTGSSRLACQENQGTQNMFKFAWHATSMSQSDNQADLIDVPPETFAPFGAACRGNGTATAYTGDNWGGAHRLFRIVAGSHTQLATVASTVAATLRLRVQAVGSTIKSDDAGLSWRHTVTDTTITSGLRVGLYFFPTSSGSTNYRIVQDFYATDFLSSSSSGSTNAASLRNQYKRGMLWPTDGM